MRTPVSSIRNLGPAFEASCAKAGIQSAKELRVMGPDDAYARLLETGTQPHFIGYYVLVMALQGRPWNDCNGAEKTTLRKVFDSLKAAHKPELQHDIDKLLDDIGVRKATP